MDFQRMVRKGNFKLVHYPKVHKTFLFDLAQDPLEIHDLAENAQYTSTVQELKATLMDLQKQVGDTLALFNKVH